MTASHEESSTATASESREIAATRLFDAPRELVWRMWTDREHVIHWWGPNGFTNTIDEMDVRPGGAWNFVMHGPDGTDYVNKCVYVDVAAPERLVYDHVTGPTFRASVTFAARGEQTEVTMRMQFESAEKRNDVAEKFGAVEGLNQTLDHLREKLAALMAHDLVITRTIDAPRAVVWNAWTDERHVGQWWGPRHFTTAVCTLDVRPGGAIRIDMQGPDGTIYPMSGSFVDLREPERLVMTTRAMEDADGHAKLETLNVITFEEEGGKTRLTMRGTVLKLEPEAVQAVVGMRQGWSETLDKLAEFAQQRAASAGPEFRISRTFDAPRDLVWRAWTEHDHLMQWWGPKGMKMMHCTIDLRPGGVMHYGLEMPNGGELWGKWVYREVTPPEQFVFVASFSDREGGVTRHPMAPNWPREMLSTLTFEEDGGKTRLTLVTAPINATEDEEAVFAGAIPSMNNGWGGTLDQLEQHLGGN
jgi:uncharacterized protein YndB with AHSA1/START domain